MFTTALAFIIFTGYVALIQQHTHSFIQSLISSIYSTSFALQGHSIADNVELGVGADLVVLAPSTNFPVNKGKQTVFCSFQLCFYFNSLFFDDFVNDC